MLLRRGDIMNENTLKKIIEEIKGVENTYPKDIFTWDNKEKITLTRGRFNQFIYSIVENTKEDILKIIKENMEDI